MRAEDTPRVGGSCTPRVGYLDRARVGYDAPCFAPLQHVHTQSVIKHYFKDRNPSFVTLEGGDLMLRFVTIRNRASRVTVTLYHGSL